MKVADALPPLGLTGTVELDSAVPEQSVVPKRLNVIVPVGALPPRRVAVSVMEPPMRAVAVARVLMVGLAFAMETSPASPHAVATALLLKSPR